ncbi:hypothetical protein EUGRSUZ_H00138 [Eucalyptus grandis]|uniref:Uncharacterized protein n=2 Tax=Eucalyptus grandis TaxID=71139 RepID=A0ACC3JL82_EUCGR|nr:hypothetical protein EUGRSUZ_H00138 [Eucalyptus grandis]
MRVGCEMSYHPRRILPPGETRKRKEREAFYSAAPGAVAKTTTPRPFPRPPPVPVPAPAPAPAPAKAAGKAKPAEEKGDNRLLAGYMALEFLTKGTLFGQRVNPARLEAAPVSVYGRPAEPKRAKPGAEPSHKKKKKEEHGGKGKEEHASYADVAGILKSEGAHLPGIVNPTQLARWIHQT